MAVDQPTSESTSLSSPTPAAGLDLAPVRGVRYATRNGDDLARLTCPPYDVIDDDQRAALESADPRNVVRLILPRDDESGPGTRYRNAARTLSEWLASAVLVPDPAPGLYAYEMTGNGDAVRGLIGSLRLLEASAGVVLPHEDTMPGPVRHRLELIEATQANLEPIFLVTDGAPGAAAEAVHTLAAEQPPLVALRAADGSSHRLWSITDPTVLAGIAADLLPRRALIADGHHRYEAYLQHQAARHRSGAATGPWDRGLAFLVDASAFGARVQAFHRVVLTLSWADALGWAASSFRVTKLDPDLGMALNALDNNASGTAFVLTDGQNWSLLTDADPAALDASLPAGRSAAWRGLDVVALHHLLLDRLWHVEVTEQTVRYVADPRAAVHLAEQRGGVAVLLNPTPLDTVLAVAAAGERMPQKSTLFAPKPRTGLVLRTYADDMTDGSGPAR